MRYKNSFIIKEDERLWGGRLDNEGNHIDSMLLNLGHGRKYLCCLGEIAKQCGSRLEEIRSICEPEEILRIPKRLRFLLDEEGHNSELAQEAMIINDDMVYTKKAYTEKKKKLIELFKMHGYKITFVASPGYAKRVLSQLTG